VGTNKKNWRRYNLGGHRINNLGFALRKDRRF
jgi:hypothetical protein